LSGGAKLLYFYSNPIQLITKNFNLLVGIRFAAGPLDAYWPGKGAPPLPENNRMAVYSSFLLRTSRKISLFFSLFLALGVTVAANYSYAQDTLPSTDQDSTITYPATYFAEFDPFSVSDMLDRIPGINVARSGGPGGGGGSGSSRGSDRRGLGAGGNQVLINGRRIAGKENEGNDQLSRIPASQVEYIEILPKLVYSAARMLKFITCLHEDISRTGNKVLSL